MLKGCLQQSKNKLRDESTGLIKEILNEIYNLRNSFISDTKGMGLMFSKISEDIKVLKEQKKKIIDETSSCELRVKNCENQIGYHLLGNSGFWYKGKDKDNKQTK